MFGRKRELSEEEYDAQESYDGEYDSEYDYDEEAYYDEEYYDEEGEYYDEEYDEAYDEEYDEYYDEDEYYEERPRSLGRTVVYMLIVIVLSLVVAVGLWFAADDVLALTKPDNPITITIRDGDTLEDVAQNLKDRGLVNYKFLFVLYGKFSNAEEKISTGTFDLNQMYDYHALVNGISYSSETRETITLTFREGYTCDQIFQMLEENGVCTVAELEETAANYEFDHEHLQQLPYGEVNRLEGYLFPDTYEFYLDDEPVRVINKLLNNFNAKFTDEMLAAIDVLNEDIRARMEEEGSFSAEEIEDAMMDVYKIVTVASLIEREAGADSERTTIASVIYNRLTTRVHELLQIDASVEYALGEHKTKLTESDLAVDDPYNTYKYKGLPPGPIANPGLSSIMAAIYPENTDYFFYALNANGTHNFFDTYMDQQDFLNGVTSEESEDDSQQEEGEASVAEEPEEGENVAEEPDEDTEEPTNAQ